jgi:hypothetical protein
MATDILHFGMPNCFDTGSDKAGHKPMKKAAKFTQKRKDLFDEQVRQRMAEVHALDIANEEMQMVDCCGNMPMNSLAIARRRLKIPQSTRILTAACLGF